jgi:nitroreductase
VTLPTTPDELLTTTRTVRRRLDLDRPVPDAVIRECLEIAVQAPTASNRQDWRFLVITDAELRTEVAGWYRRSFAQYRSGDSHAGAIGGGDPARHATQQRVVSSADHLTEHMHEVPVLLLPCIRRRGADGGTMAQASLYGSVIPATWSFMLAARARGLGTAWTTLHLRYEREVAQLLAIPFEEVTQVALVPVAYTVGTAFAPAPRAPLDEAVGWNGW